MPKPEIDWETVNWTRRDAELALAIGVSRSAVYSRRLRHTGVSQGTFSSPVPEGFVPTDSLEVLTKRHRVGGAKVLAWRASLGFPIRPAHRPRKPVPDGFFAFESVRRTAEHWGASHDTAARWMRESGIPVHGRGWKESMKVPDWVTGDSSAQDTAQRANVSKKTALLWIRRKAAQEAAETLGLLV